jgi:hypothetical protein
VTTQLQTLYALRDRWVREYPHVLEIDAIRAGHHAEGIADLELLIGRLERASRRGGGEAAHVVAPIAVLAS